MDSVKGGGMTYYDINKNLNTSLIYGEGLRVPNTAAHLELDGLMSSATFGKRKPYERVNA